MALPSVARCTPSMGGAAILRDAERKFRFSVFKSERDEVTAKAHDELVQQHVGQKRVIGQSQSSQRTQGVSGQLGTSGHASGIAQNPPGTRQTTLSRTHRYCPEASFCAIAQARLKIPPASKAITER